MASLALSAGIGVTTLAGTSLLAGPAAHAAAQDIVAVDAATRQADAQLILDEINRYRESLGAKPLKYSATLSQVVQKESDRQIVEEKFSHSTTFLTDPRTGPWTSANEVIAVSESGIRTREDVMRMQECGFRGALVGESLLRASDRATAVRTLLEDP